MLANFMRVSGIGVLLIAVFLTSGDADPDIMSTNRVQPAAVVLASPTPPLMPTLPPLVEQPGNDGIRPLVNLQTHIPDRPSLDITTHTVRAGETAWSIAEEHGLQPETILWGNEWLSTEAGQLQVGVELKILPLDGALHTIKAGDTWERIERLHGVSMAEIAAFPGNEYDPLPPFELPINERLIIPAGRSPLVWVEPGPQIIAGLGRKSPGYYDGLLKYTGTGYFIWPIAPPIRITQSFWGSHPAIDMQTYHRQPIFASDSGTVIFSGWSNSGYGNLVIIDHGNGYWTYYAHNEANLVAIGQGVLQGQQIAESGSTGNSSGTHLDFRIRVDGGSFLNPFDFLPRFE